MHFFNPQLSTPNLGADVMGVQLLRFLARVRDDQEHRAVKGRQAGPA